MKNKRRIFPLAVWAALCLSWAALIGGRSQNMVGLFSFPFSQLGALLRAMSLKGAAGNAAAIGLYVLLSLLPILLALGLKMRGQFRQVDWLLGLVSLMLFIALYLMINPGLLRAFLAEGVDTSLGKALIGGAIDSVLLSYIVLRLVLGAESAGSERLLKSLRLILWAMSAALILNACGLRFREMLLDISRLRSQNTMPGVHLGMSTAFIAVNYLLSALPYLLDVLILLYAAELTDALEESYYSPGSAGAAEKLSKLCKSVLLITVFLSCAFNFLQLLFARSLLVIDARIELPLLPMSLVLAAMLLARLIGEGRQLKDDNDSFI